MINFNLTQEEAAAIINVIGQMPTQSGAYPLHQNLLKQYTDQTSKQSEEAPKE